MSSTHTVHEHLVRELLSSMLGRGGRNVDPERWGMSLLRDAVRESATDVHINPRSDGTRIRLRIDGAVHHAAHLPHGQAQQLINQLKSLGGLNPIVGVLPAEAHFETHVDDTRVDLRMTTVACFGGEKLHIRLLSHDYAERPLEELGMTGDHLSKIDRWLADTKGLVLVTGPTGSGKSTTLYALLQRLMDHPFEIVTIEDPIEYQLDGVTQIQVNLHAKLTFAEGIKAILRLDPDCILVGETRDAASARASLVAGTSGQILLTSMHARDAVGAVTSLRNWGVHDASIATLLALVVNQRLVRKLCEQCRYEVELSDGHRRWLDAMRQSIEGPVWEARGCEACKKLGYKGRTGIFEIWQLEGEDYEHVLRHVDERSLRSRLSERGHPFLIVDAMDKVKRGITTLTELQITGGLGPRF